MSSAEAPAQHGHVKSGRAAAALYGTIWSMVSSLAPALVGLLVFLATSRVLTPAEFGLVSFAAGIATFGAAIAPAGFREALIQRNLITQKHLDAVFWLCVGAGLLIYAGLILASGPIAANFDEAELALLIPFISLRVVFDMAAVVPNGLLVRGMSFKKLALRSTVASLIAGLGCLALLWAGFGLWALAFSQLATSVVACIGALVAARWRPHFTLDFGALRELGAFGLFSTGNHFITTLSVDQIMIGAFLGPAGLGIYGFARRIFQILTDLITGALNLVSYSLLSSLQDEQEKLRNAYLFGTFASSIVAFPVFAGLALIAPDFIPLAFGAQWLEAVPVVQAFCALGLLTAIGILQASLVKSQGQADLWFYYMVGKQVATALYVVLFSGWGVGALTNALVILNFIMWLPTLHMVVRLLGISVFAYLGSFALPVLATLVMIGAGIFIESEMAGFEPLMRLGVTVAGCGLVYTAVVLLLGWKRIMEIKATLAKRGR